MSVKEGFSDAEWLLLEQSAFWVFHTVANADGIIDKKEKKSFYSSFTKS